MLRRRFLRVPTLRNYIISDSISNPYLLRAYSSFGGDNDDDDGSSSSSSWPSHRRRSSSQSASRTNNINIDANYQSRRSQQPQQPRFNAKERLRKQFDDDSSRRYGVPHRSSNNNDNDSISHKHTRVNKIDGNANLFPFGNEERNPRNSKQRQLEPVPHLNDDVGFLEKFKLGFDQGNNNKKKVALHSGESEGAVPEPTASPPPPPPPADAEEIFKKMKETGLIPNAVAMLHGLCTDGLVQEAMKLFGLMREKGTIPEVVIYTAVVEGFCKAQKLEDAKRIFRKMQNNGISPNAFSYSVLIQGLYINKSLDDALEFCLEMLEAGHSPNLTTFTGLVDGFCRERGLEAAEAMVVTLRRKGFLLDDRAVREYLEKKGPFLPAVWEAIFGKMNNSKKSFLTHPKQRPA